MKRISIAGLLGFVIAFALGLAAVVNASEFWAGAMSFLTIVTLLGSVLGTVLRGWRSGGWLGFAVFGWGYYFSLILMLGLADEMVSLSETAAVWVFEKANPAPSVVVSIRTAPLPPPVLPTYEVAPPPALPPSPIPPPADSSVPPPSPSVPLDIDLIRPSIPPDPNAELTAALDHRAERLERARAIGRRFSVLGFAGLGAILGILLARGIPRGVTSAPVI